MYELYVKQALAYQALFETTPSQPLPTSRTSALGMAGSGMGAIGVSYGGSVHGQLADVSKWDGTIKPMLYRVAAVGCMLMSLVLVWCEGTILLDGDPFNLNLSQHLFRHFVTGSGSLLRVFRLLRLCEWLAPRKHSSSLVEAPIVKFSHILRPQATFQWY